MADVKILLVEDENIEAMDIKRTLEFFGYEVPYVASSGEEAVEKALEIMPDLILIDVVLIGDSDGIDVASKIKEHNMPVIFITAHSEESTIERAKHTEPYGIIIKPYNRIELKYAIELALYKSQMENELKESEYNLRLILNSTAEGIFGIDLEGLCTFCNTSSLNILGYDNPNELIGKNIHDLIHQYETSILGFKTGKHVHMADEEFMMADGTIFSAEYWSYPQIKDHEIIGAVVTFKDITERKQAENELLESEDFLKNIVENIPNMIFIKSADKLNFEMVNKAGEELMGYSREELIGKTDYDFFPKNEADFFTQKDREVLQNKKLLDIPEETIENKNLGQRILHTKKIPIFNKEGNPQYLLGVSEDITERKNAEKALINSEKRYRTLYSSMTEGLAFHKLIYDDSYDPVDYEIVDVNSAYEEILGISRKEILGKKASAIYGTDKAPYLEIYYEVAQKGNPTHFETYFEPMDKHFSISVFSPSIGTFATIFEDITERKIAEEQLKKSLAEKEVLLREIHHRVKNNLQIIASLLHLQEGCIDKKDMVVDVLKESQGRVKSMAMVHEKLYQSPNLTEINFKQYIEKLVYDILCTYGIKIGTIKVQLDIEDTNLNIDTAIPLGLVINELITNSVKHAFPKSEGTITIKLKSQPENMAITIADDGIGLPKDIKLENPEKLGLQLVQSLVNQLDGDLKLNTDNGTEFKITFKELKYKKRI
ncbi:PAS domain S-box protein [Methanobacterium spitsbergense]|uniref:PAS domain S-box protein n=1 Tax=Methanobacterium spitsbergense TaxID=2874285 RepID=A0A8T5UYT2_9EURY|nr:PAS domain S-box protein [Methanobacterium spitsbergense]MBZ2164575.1 PAS domain S-box protein [Methanobacterium spitsbergense]